VCGVHTEKKSVLGWNRAGQGKCSKKQIFEKAKKKMEIFTFPKKQFFEEANKATGTKFQYLKKHNMSKQKKCSLSPSFIFFRGCLCVCVSEGVGVSVFGVAFSARLTWFVCVCVCGAFTAYAVSIRQHSC